MRVLVFGMLFISSFNIHAQYLIKNNLEATQVNSFNRDSSSHHLPSKISRSILLDEVTINSTRHYKGDSLRLRKDFSSVFNSTPPRFKEIFITKNPDNRDPIPYYRASGSTASILSLDVFSLIGLLGKNKSSTSKLQQKLLDKERTDYIDQIFSQQKIQQLTGLKNDSLLHFMEKYRPTLSNTQQMSIYELLIYIKESYAEYSSKAN